MTYTPQVWTNNDPATPINGPRLSVIENGIETVDATVTALDATVTALDGRVDTLEAAGGGGAAFGLFENSGSVTVEQPGTSTAAWTFATAGWYAGNTITSLSNLAAGLYHLDLLFYMTYGGTGVGSGAPVVCQPNILLSGGGLGAVWQPILPITTSNRQLRDTIGYTARFDGTDDVAVNVTWVTGNGCSFQFTVGSLTVAKIG